MKPQIKRIEFGEFGVVSAIEFFEGSDPKETLQIALVLSHPTVDRRHIKEQIEKALNEFIDANLN